MEVSMIESVSEMEGNVRRARRLVAFGGMCLILLAQFLVFSRPLDESRVFPPFTWLAILGIVMLVLSLLIPSTTFFQKIAAWSIFRERVFWVLAAFLLSVIATVATANYMVSTRMNYIPVMTIWLLSAVAYLYAFFNGAIHVPGFLAWVGKNRNEILSVAVVTCLAAILRFYRLGEIPRILDGDEGRIGLLAQQTAFGYLANPFSLWENFGGIYLQLINISMRFFGIDAFGLRLLPAIGGVLAVPSLYLFARWIGGRRIAFITIVLLAFSHSHIHFSRIVSVAYIHGTWLAPLELYFFISGMEKRESWRTALGGIILAMHFSVYLTSQVIFGLILIYMLIVFVFYRTWFKARFSQAAVFLGGFMIMIMPSALYSLRNPTEFFNRLGQDGTFQSGWLMETMQSTGQNAFQILFARFVHVFLSLIYYPSIDFYGSASPMLSIVSATMLLIGVVIALWRLRNPAYLLLNGYFWGAVFSIAVFAIPPSADTYRVLMALPAALVLVAVGLDQILELLGLGYEEAPNAYIVSSSAILVGMLAFNLWTYYGDFAGRCRFGGDLFVARFASYLGSYVKTIDNELPVYLLSDGLYYYGTHSSTDFLSNKRKITNFPDAIETLKPVSGETIIAVPERIAELQAWAREHPGGQLNFRYDCENTILLAYRVP
jgi:hypothetical protein